MQAAVDRYVATSRFLHARLKKATTPYWIERYQSLILMNDDRFAAQMFRAMETLREDIIKTCKELHGGR